MPPKKMMNPMNGGRGGGGRPQDLRSTGEEARAKPRSQDQQNGGKKQQGYVTSNRTTDRGLEYGKSMSIDRHQSGKGAPPPPTCLSTAARVSYRG